jgi:K+-sensing histidine kinase KdpD
MKGATGLDRLLCESVYAALPFGVCVLDHEGLILDSNRTLQRMFGWNLARQERPPLSRYLEEAIADPAQLLSWLVAVNEVLSLRRTIFLNLPVEFRTEHGVNSSVSVIGAITPWEGPHAEQTGALVTFCDSALHTDLDGIRTRFLSVVAHSLGSPLTNVVAAADRLAKYIGERDCPEGRLLEIIQSEADRLGRMLKQAVSSAPVLDAAHRASQDVVALRPLIRRTAYTFRVREPSCELALHIPSDLPYVVGNADRIQEALCNLVENALQHTPPGTSIEVSAGLADAQVLVRVADSGRGLSDQGKELSFEPIGPRAQAKPSIVGRGLGLPIARALIQGMGGELWYEEPPGGGAAFCFTLPCVAEESEG